MSQANSANTQQLNPHSFNTRNTSLNSRRNCDLNDDRDDSTLKYVLPNNTTGSSSGLGKDLNRILMYYSSCVDTKNQVIAT